jgi:hypothetical protein
VKLKTFGVVCYWLHERMGNFRYRVAADGIVNLLSALHVLDSTDPSLNGAIPRAFALNGSYMTAGYPNWATKHFPDGLLLPDRL